jgi:hypothetical protein
LQKHEVPAVHFFVPPAPHEYVQSVPAPQTTVHFDVPLHITVQPPIGQSM